MPNAQPKSRPEPPPAPAKDEVYGGQWGSGGKPGEPADKDQTDRPEPIDATREAPGAGEG